MGISNKSRTGVVAAVTLTKDDYFVSASVAAGSFTITLPPASSWGGAGNSGQFFIARTDASANVLTIAAAPGDTIDGAASITVAASAEIIITGDGVTSFVSK